MAGERRTIEVETGVLEIEVDDNWCDTLCVCGKRPEICRHTAEDRARLMQDLEVGVAADKYFQPLVQRMRRGRP